MALSRRQRARLLGTKKQRQAAPAAGCFRNLPQTMHDILFPRRRVLTRATFALCCAFAVASAPAQSTTTSSSSSGDAPQKLGAYIVTGSNIPTTLTAAEAGTFPVIEIDRDAIDKTGYQSAAELLQKITVSNGAAVPISNNATGFTPAASSVSLRGLGPDATLVLINGHRVANYPIGVGGNTAFVDLNTIPISAIDRVEVLKDGASAVYDADAVAGVVNVMLRRGFNGTEAFAGYQNTTHKDSSQFTGSVLTGVSNDKGSLMVGFNYQSRASIANRDRIYSSIPPFLSSNSSPINLQITQAAYDEALKLPAGTNPAGVAATAKVFFATPGPLTSDGLPTSSNNNGTTPPGQYIYSGGRSSVYNFNQDSLSFPSWTRYGAILSGEREIFDSPNAKLYFDGSYQSNMTENQLAPAATGSFTTPGATELVIPARTATPLPTADGRARAAVAGAFNPFNPFNVDITGGTRFRLKEFGNRIFHDTNESFLASAGIREDKIADRFNLDAGFRYSQINYRANDQLVSATRFNRVLNAADPIFNPNSAQYIGTTVPYNPFGYYVNPIASNAKVVKFATVHTHDNDDSSLGNGYVTLNTANLFDVPAGGVGAAVGLDYRVETLAQHPDELNVTGDVVSSSPTAVTSHTRKVWAGYGEVEVPLASPQHRLPFAYNLSVDLAARYEKFLTNSDSVAVPKIGVRYQPFDESLTFRGSAARGFLEPSLYKLYAGGVAGLLTLVDPRNGSTLQETPTIQNGNPRLKAEKSKSYTFGVVWSPKAGPLKGFTTNVDLWRIERRGQALSNIQDTLDRWAGHDSTGAAKPGGLQTGEAVILDAAGNVDQVVTNYLNAGDYLAQGVDVGASYVYGNERIGRFDFAAAVSYLGNLKIASLPGTPLAELVGTDNTPDAQGNDAYLRLKGRGDIHWVFHGWSAGVSANYLGHFIDYDFAGNQRQAGGSTTWDAQLAYAFGSRFGPYLANTKLTVGSNNIFAHSPPVVQYFGANSTNYAGFLYTSEDRLVYVSLTKRF
jgi:iron complex outermembrane recepter protein